jgi:two-component system sensor histidine kinase MtrB
MRLDEIRHRFVTTASHELRTPTAAIYGAAETLERLAGTLSEEQEADLRRMLSQEAARLATLVDQLLDVSRLEAHAIDIKPERIRVSPKLETIVSRIGPKDSITVESPSDLEIDADAVAFDRIVGNLIANALRHGAPPIVVSARRDHRHLRITVEDRGEGVPPEFRSQLFEQFTRSTASEGKPGSGLGLAIARSYAHAHGGDVLYKDAQPNGARFEFVLPA